MNITYLLPIIIAVVYLMIIMSSKKILTAYIVKRNIKRKRGLNQNMNELRKRLYYILRKQYVC